jgi:ribonuclease PH
MKYFGEVEKGLVEDALSSCILRFKETNVICSINIREKQEGEDKIEVILSSSEPNESIAAQNNRQMSSLIKSSIENTFRDRMEKTLVSVYFYCISEDVYLFTACINAFSLCAIDTGLNFSDMVCSSVCFFEGDELVSGEGSSSIYVAYNIHNNSIAQFYYTGNITRNSLRDGMFHLINECNRCGVELKEYYTKMLEKPQ